MRSADRLDGQVAIVTGGASGIGAATVALLAADGASVVVADVDVDSAERIAEAARVQGGEASAVCADIADESAVAALVDTTVSRYGRVDILDNNAALTDREVLAEDTDVGSMDAEVWDRMFAVNLRGQMLTTKYVVPHMVAQRHGAIVNVSSGAALKGDLIRTSYSASKAGIESLTRSIATQYGRAGVRANTIVPGLILTDAARSGIPEDLLARYTSTTLTPYIGAPRDVADLIRFLVGEQSRYITGQTFVIDGGMSIHSARFPGLTTAG